MTQDNQLTPYEQSLIAYLLNPLPVRRYDIDDRDRYEERELQCDMCERDYDHNGEIDRDRFNSERD